MAAEQRATAEKQAIERKKQKVQEEQEALRLRKEKKGRRRDDSDDDLEDIPVASGMMLADLSDQLAGRAFWEAPTVQPVQSFESEVKQGHEAADHTEASRKHVVAEDLQEGNNDNVQMLLERLSKRSTMLRLIKRSMGGVIS
eukprot:symbB.v1.2.027920.t1/scaffold2891.1/size67802/2